MPQVSDAKKTNGSSAPVLAAIRYGYLSFVGEFQCRGPERLTPDKPVLVETDRGLELGRFICYLTSVPDGFCVDRKDINDYLKNSGDNYLRERAGRTVRLATPQDLREEEHIRADAMEKKRFCSELAERFGLKMKIVCVEHLFGGERIVFYFTAEGRVDFRDLVRDLAREYQTRIELRQIGARDEARLLADFEICGRQCCCKNFLKTLRPVNMKMAKLQKATLDPSKVSGRCGRLRCCLAFEHTCYEDLVRQLPKVGSLVQTPQGVGRVRDRHILTQLVQVVLEGNRPAAFPVEEVSPAEGPSQASRSEPRVAEQPVLQEMPADDGDVTDLKPDEGGSRPRADSSGGGAKGRRRRRRSRRRR